jgi:hypothetical protein
MHHCRKANGGKKTPWVSNAHLHLYGGEDVLLLADEVVKKMDEAGVWKAVLFDRCYQPYPNNIVYRDVIRVDANVRVRCAYERCPDRFYPTPSGFAPPNPNSVEYIEG